jgi:antirestriction protein ArdC
MTASTTAKASRDIHAEVTASIIAAIEASPRAPRMPWLQSNRPLHLPRNALTRNNYNGINILQLWATGFVRGYDQQLWASYRQWAQVSGQVKQGERGTTVAFYKTYEVEPKADDPDDDGSRRVLKTSVVFNIHQVTGYAPPAGPPPRTLPADPWQPLDSVEDFIIATGADIRHGGDQAYFHRLKDFVQMPERTSFVGTETSTPLEAYYAVLLHELTHWTGTSFRLDRTFGQRFGDAAYAAEELVAELGSAFMCAELGITPAPRADHAQYLAHWLKLLKSDKRAIFVAAAKASEAARFLAAGVGMPAEETRP